MTPKQLRALDAKLAEKVMGLPPELIHFEQGGKMIRYGGTEFHVAPCDRYSQDQMASKSLRDKLGERWDWLLGQGKLGEDELPYGFALYEKGFKGDDYIAAAEADTEELAVALCACKPYGIEVPA